MSCKVDTVTFRFFTCQSYNNFGSGFDKIEKVSQLEVIHFIEYCKVNDGGELEDVKEAIAKKSDRLVTVYIPQGKFETSGIRTMYQTRIKKYLPEHYTVKCLNGFFTLFVEGKKVAGAKGVTYRVLDTSYISTILDTAQGITILK